jgi:NAD(P)-dependent dehydrogenase (short-subunit alcohol dehydrogenase family)
MSSPVLLILGAGPGIGLSVAKSFAAQGYKVALAARSVHDGVGEDGYLRVQADLAHPEVVQKVFAKVKETVGIPHVVVYNSMCLSCPLILLIKYLRISDSRSKCNKTRLA